jgi:hypothetical protein
VSTTPDPTPDQAVQKLIFTFNEEEVRAFRKLVSARLNRRLDGMGYWGVVFLLIFVIGLVVYVAYALGLFEMRSLKPVLVTAYAAFAAGAFAYAIGGRWQYQRLVRAYYGASNEEWEYSFDKTMMTWRSPLAETRTPWRAVRAVEDNGAMVLLWLHRDARSSFIPARVFASTADRSAFVAAVAAYIAAARGGS